MPTVELYFLCSLDIRCSLGRLPPRQSSYTIKSAKEFPVFEARDRGGSPLPGNPRGGWAMRMERLVQEVGIGHGFDDAGL
jgi:hypothetical protein